MAIAKGQASSEGGLQRKLYIGVGAVRVLAVNPNKATLEKLYGRDLDKEPEYLTETEIDGKKYPSVRISFIVQTAADKNNGIDTIATHTFFLQKRYRTGSQSGKYQVIDPFGRTAWCTKEEAQSKTIPMYKDKATGEDFPANIDADFRPAFVGEEQLTMFIKKLLNIPNVVSYVNGEWVENTKVSKEDCLVRLDYIENYFKGDFKELAEIISYQPDNLVKIAFGIRHTDDNRTYQTTYDGMCLNNAVTDYSKLDQNIQERKSMGGLANTEYEAVDLHEYTVEPTETTSLKDAAATAAPAGEEDPW